MCHFDSRASGPLSIDSESVVSGKLTMGATVAKYCSIRQLQPRVSLGYFSYNKHFISVSFFIYA